MKRLTLGQVKESRIPAVLGICKDDPRLIQIVNEAQERLLNRGGWLDGRQKAKFCISDQCITWPREVAAIEAVHTCSDQVKVRNNWYEFITDYPAGCCGDCELNIEESDHACFFDEIEPTGKKIRVYAASSNDVGKRVLLQGFDDSNNWIRTSYGGQIYDGEWVTIADMGGSYYADTTSFFSSLTGVQKDKTGYLFRAYELNASTGALRAIAIWQPDEQLPSYRRSIIRGLPSGTTSVYAMVKLQHIPVEKDNDWLVIGNLPALKDMCVSVQLKERREIGESKVSQQDAIKELTHEQRSLSPQQIAIPSHGTADFNRVMGGFI